MNFLILILRVRSVYEAVPPADGNTLPGSLIARRGRHAVAFAATARWTPCGLIGESLVGEELLL